MKINSTVWLLVILAALGAYTFYFERGKAPDENGSRALSVVLGYQPEQVAKLRLLRKSGEPLWLTRDQDRWSLEKPLRSPADADEVKRMVNDLSNAMVDRVLTKEVRDLKPFGLDAPAWEIAIATQGGKMTTLQVGGKDPSGANLYVKPKDRQEVLVLSAYSLEGLQTRDAGELRDRSITSFNKEDVQRFELTTGKQTIRVERSGDSWQITAPVQAKAYSEKVDSILGTFATLKGNKIIATAPSNLKPYGLDRPVAQVSFWLHGKKEPCVATLGAAITGGDRYIKGGLNPAVMTVYSYVLSDAQVKLADLKEPVKKAAAAPPLPPVKK